MNIDDIDDPGDFDDFDSKEAELEARFQDLETDAELEKLRRMQGLGDVPPHSRKQARSPSSDPLSDMKAALEADDNDPDDARDSARKKAAPQPATRKYLLLICPACGAKNRTRLDKLRKQLPLCGGCKESLSFD